MLLLFITGNEPRCSGRVSSSCSTSGPVCDYNKLNISVCMTVSYLSNKDVIHLCYGFTICMFLWRGLKCDACFINVRKTQSIQCQWDIQAKNKIYRAKSPRLLFLCPINAPGRQWHTKVIMETCVQSAKEQETIRINQFNMATIEYHINWIQKWLKVLVELCFIKKKIYTNTLS